MLRISKLADYATIIMVFYANAEKTHHTAKAIAAATHIHEPTVSKLLKLLCKAQFLRSQRGTQGGYQLARAPEAIHLAELISAVEGQMALTECIAHDSPACGLAKNCTTKNHWGLINTAIYHALAQIRLVDLQTSVFRPNITVGFPRKAELTPSHFAFKGALT